MTAEIVPIRHLRPAPTDAVDTIRAALLAVFDNDLPAIADDPDALALGMVRLDAIRRNLDDLRAEAERLLLAAMGDDFAVDLPSVGRVERTTPKQTERWQSDALVAALVRRALDPEGTGALPDTISEAIDAVVGELVECAPFTASMSWRKNALRARGLYAGGRGQQDEDGRVMDRAGYLTFVPGRPRVRFVSADTQGVQAR